MTNQPIVHSFVLTAEKENEIMDKVVREMASEWKDDMERAFPKFMLPTMAPLPARERHARYALLTDPNDVEFLLNPNYAQMFKDQIAPPLVSDFWKKFLEPPALWDVFDTVQKDFIRWYQKDVASG